MTSRPGVRSRLARPGFAGAIAVMLVAIGAAVPATTVEARAGVTAGAHWAASQAPLPKNASRSAIGGAQIQAIDCASARFCVAVGYYNTSLGQEGLILTKSGGKWQATQAPIPAGAFHNPEVRLTSVSCPSAGNCLAVGRYLLANDAAAVGLLLTDSAGSWKARRAPDPANTYTGRTYSSAVDLNSAYCPAASTCVVAGTYTSKKLSEQGLLLTYSKKNWITKEAPISGANLVSISCASSTSCAAVGAVPDPYNDYFTLGVVVAGFGTKWAAGKAPLNGTPPTTSSSGLQSVFCTHESCTAAGHFTPPGGSTPDELLVMAGKGADWSATEIQPPASGAGLTSPDQVACPSASTCVFGADYYGSGPTVEAILTKTSAWSTELLKTPVKSYTFGPANALACASVKSCTVVGEYLYGYPTKTHPMIQQGFGTSWKGLLPPLPANGKNSQQAQLNDVSCPTATSCIAVGFYDTGGRDAGLLISESG